MPTHDDEHRSPGHTPTPSPLRGSAQPPSTARSARRTTLAALMAVLVTVALAAGVLATSWAYAVTTPADPSVGSSVRAPCRLPLDGHAPDTLSRASMRASGLLVRDFAPPSVRWGPGHRGVDLSATPAEAVLSPCAGTVTFSAVVVDRPLVVVTHLDGLRTTLEPVVGTVPVGAEVSAGEQIGHLDPAALTHCAPQSCLHWGVRRSETYLDPLALVGMHDTIVLLPEKG